MFFLSYDRMFQLMQQNNVLEDREHRQEKEVVNEWLSGHFEDEEAIREEIDICTEMEGPKK